MRHQDVSVERHRRGAGYHFVSALHRTTARVVHLGASPPFEACESAVALFVGLNSGDIIQQQYRAAQGACDAIRAQIARSGR